MSVLHFALAQSNFSTGAAQSNVDKMTELTHRAGQSGAQLVVFPELALSGPVPGDLLEREDYRYAMSQALTRVFSRSGETAMLVARPYADRHGLFANAPVMAHNGIASGWYQKQVPRRTHTDGARLFHTTEHVCSFHFEGVRFAVLMDEDVDNPSIQEQVAKEGFKLAFVLAAAPWVEGCETEREEKLCAFSRQSGCALAWVNHVGGQDEALFDGASLLINTDGSIVYRAPAFSEQVLNVQFDDETGQFTPLDWPQQTTLSRDEKLYQALVCGLRDYVHKNGQTKALIGLSGGIDSALTLTLVVDALGADQVTAVMLPSRYTSSLSLDLAQQQITTLGVTGQTLEIEQPLAAMQQTLAPCFAGKAADLTEENLQARIRGTLLMALSNKLGGLLLVTGNKSEVAVGYSTLYGDMCGAFAPLKDVYKTRVWALSRWRNQQGQGDVIPTAVIERAPSAELRDGQKDQDSLPPYELLDELLELIIEKGWGKADLLWKGYNETIVKRVLHLVFLNEFKRGQGAIGPRVSTKSFGRDRQFPITSSWRG